MRILFLGEGSLDGPARYLAAILKWSRIPFDHLPDQSRIPIAWFKRSYDAVILSDYRYPSWTPVAKEWLMTSVQSGTGLCMIGGWASYTGLVGKYAGTVIEGLLPVRCSSKDDRVNRPAALVGPSTPGIVVNGYHRCRVKPGAKTWLAFRDLNFRKGKPILGSSHPALVTGTAGKGRTLAFLTDCAPHWAGGLVDWGRKRVTVHMGADHTVEVGDAYLRFFRHWILWSARLNSR